MKKPIVTLVMCGSMRFAKQMQATAQWLESTLPVNILHPTYNVKDPSEEDIRDLSNLHKRKIDSADGIYVMDIYGYVGKSTREEISYARDNGKVICYHSESFLRLKKRIATILRQKEDITV